MMVRRFFGLLCLALACSASLAGVVYEWTDDEGRKYYSDTAPEDRNDYKINGRYDRPYVHTVPPVRPQNLNPDPRPKHSGRAHFIPKGNKAGESSGARCRYYLERIAYYDDRLRAGYSNGIGNVLRRERRKHSEKYYSECR